MKNKNFALITGASGGIGKDLAEIFASNGHNLILVARSKGKLNEIAQQLAEKYKVEVHVIVKDLGLPNASLELYEEVKDKQVEYLVNNAGFGDFGAFVETDLAKEMEMINLNIIALTQLTKYFVKDMVKRKSGRILNLGSNGSFISGPLMAVYCATKHYVLAFSEAISVELERTGVTVTCLCPGPTTSGFQKASNNENSKLVKGRKLADSKEVAQLGYDSMMKGKMTVIHSFKTKMQIFSTRFAPRRMVAKMAMSAMKE